MVARVANMHTLLNGGGAYYFQDDGKGGVGFKGGRAVAFMTALAGLTTLAVVESTLPSFCLSYKKQCQEMTVTVLAVSAVVAVSVMTATPLKLNPPFSSS